MTDLNWAIIVHKPLFPIPHYREFDFPTSPCKLRGGWTYTFDKNIYITNIHQTVMTHWTVSGKYQTFMTNWWLITFELLQVGCRAAAEFTRDDTAGTTAAVQFTPKYHAITVAISNALTHTYHQNQFCIHVKASKCSGLQIKVLIHSQPHWGQQGPFNFNSHAHAFTYIQWFQINC